MTRKEKAGFVAEKLTELYPKTTIPLDHTDPYTLLVAVVLSAQCTDKKVNEITPLLFAQARTPQQMVKLSVEEIQDIIRPCGLSPMKSEGIHGRGGRLRSQRNVGIRSVGNGRGNGSCECRA